MMSKLLDKPLVSVVIPSYNQWHFIEEVILPMGNQGYPNKGLL